MLEVKGSEANFLNSILRKATVHHLLGAVDPYMLTATIAKLLPHSRREINNGRFTKEEESQPEVKRQPESNMNLGDTAQAYGDCYSIYTANIAENLRLCTADNRRDQYM
jgi:hypothetical protein